MEASKNKQKHFVLVHAACHGAWTWYKLKPLLEAAGHRVTALDLTASGINMKPIQEVHTLRQYTQPLLDFLASLPDNEQVILVGHSLGGLNLALASDNFPHKVSVNVFVTAFMPDTTHKPSYVPDQFGERNPAENWLDTEFVPHSESKPNEMCLRFGPSFLAQKLYQNCSVEDVELGKLLVRHGYLFGEDLSKCDKFSEEGYGRVKRVFIICEDDQTITKEFQKWMIDNYNVKKVMEIKGADHAAMLSKPKELCDCLCDIAFNA